LLGMSVLLLSCSILPRSWTRKTHYSAADLHSENPVIQIKAIHEAVTEKDLTQVLELIQLMLHEEPSVRSQAYWGVTQLTGLQRPSPDGAEYHYYDPKEDRARVVQDWIAYWKRRMGS
jgi:hypothetical protein